MNRLSQHKRDKPWWTEVSIIKVEHFKTRENAEKEERRAIKKEKPLHNKEHTLQHLSTKLSRNHAKLIANSVIKLQLQHKGLRKLSAAMNREGIPTHREGSRWHPTSVRRLLFTIKMIQSTQDAPA
jgi:U3 small nucleolar RNA-associated protein 14